MENQTSYWLNKTLIMEDQNTNKCVILKQVQIQVLQNMVDFQQLIEQTVPILKEKYIKIYDFECNKYVLLHDLLIWGKISVNFLDNIHNIILIKFYSQEKQIESLVSFQSNKYLNKSQSSLRKIERSKQRTILQVIHIVKEWRELCKSKRGSSINLSQAAQIIGFPKKSLDDYYYQLRMGQKYGFDFHSNIYNGIGILRNFLKNFKTQRKFDKSQKLPQNLKITSQISRYQIIKEKQILSQRVQNKKYKNIDEQNEVISTQKEIQQDCFYRQIGIENDFYKQFNYNFGNQIDPFISLKYNDSYSEQKYFSNTIEKMQQQNDNQFNLF